MSSSDCRSLVEMENKEGRKLLEHDMGPSEELLNGYKQSSICVC